MNFKNFLFQYSIGENVYRKEVKAKSFVVGRSSRCDIRIDFEIISRKHMKVFFEDDCIRVMDLGSTNGTFLNGTKLKPHIKSEYKTDDEIFVEGAGLHCYFKIKNTFQKGTKAHLLADELEMEEVSFRGSKPAPDSNVKRDSADIPAPDSNVKRDSADIPAPDSMVKRDFADIPAPDSIVKRDFADIPAPDSIVKRDSADTPAPDSIVKRDFADKPDSDPEVEMEVVDPRDFVSEISVSDPFQEMGLQFQKK